MRRFIGLAAAAMLAGGALAQGGAQPAAAPIARGDTTLADYAQDASWLCRAGKGDAACSSGIDAVALAPDGKRTMQPFAAAADPKIDCFYVYPTASDDPTLFSDLKPDASEERVVRAQAARLSQVCRLFVPMYHQFTGTALRLQLSGAGMKDDEALGTIADIPYRDVAAAWASYLKNDNQGRGVVLIGHSQGALILKRLIADEIDGKPVMKRLVGAYLAGNIGLGAHSFKAVPPCQAMGQTGCVVAWSSYAEGYPGPRLFGAPPKGDAPLCVNPAALAGGRGALNSYIAKPAYAPAEDPPFVELVGQETAECVADDKGAVLRVRVEPGLTAGLLEAGLAQASAARPLWGLHTLDVSLVQGNVVELIAAQAKGWR